MSAEHDEFIRLRTGYCVSMHCRLTRESCATIRRRDMPMPQCADCPGPDFGDGRSRPVWSGKAKAVAPSRRTVTIRELARLAGVNYASIFAIVRAFKNGERKGGPTAAKLQKTIDDNNLTWNDVVRQTPARVGRKRPSVQTRGEAA